MKRRSDVREMPPINELAVRRARAAELFDISPGTFDNWVRRGLMPQAVKIGGLRRWDTEDIRASWSDLKELGASGEEDDGENPFDHVVG